MNILPYDNFHYDEKSRHQFQQLNESLFVERVFGHLSTIMGESFSDYDFHVFSHHGSDQFPSSIGNTSARKKVLLFLSDELGTDPKPYSHHYYAVFKTYIGNNSSQKNVFPIPLGYVKDVSQFPVKPIAERSINVFFRGNFNSNRLDFYRSLSWWKWLIPKRFGKHAKFYRSLMLRFKKDFSKCFPSSVIILNDGFKKGYSPQEYGKVLSESKIVLCPKGYDMAESFRHFESMRAGCIVISEQLPDTEFYTGSPIIQINNWEEGLSKVKELLSDPTAMAAIQKATVNWWKERCSELATARYIHAKLVQLEDLPMNA